jgi:hypothetical protein
MKELEDVKEAPEEFGKKQIETSLLSREDRALLLHGEI